MVIVESANGFLLVGGEKGFLSIVVAVEEEVEFLLAGGGDKDVLVEGCCCCKSSINLEPEDSFVEVDVLGNRGEIGGVSKGNSKTESGETKPSLPLDRTKLSFLIVDLFFRDLLLSRLPVELLNSMIPFPSSSSSSLFDFRFELLLLIVFLLIIVEVRLIKFVAAVAADDDGKD